MVSLPRSILATVAAAAVVGLLGATAAADAAKRCHPSYKGACLKRNASDYDCAGGGGDGPYFVYRVLRVVGPDVFRLDRDKDGLACEED